MTHSTSLSLLERLRASEETEDIALDWRRFVELYDPLLRGWLRQKSIPADHVDDIVQNAMAVVVKKLRDFQHNGRAGAFRTWLRSITLNCLREHWREQKSNPRGAGGSEVQMLIAELEDPESQTSRIWNEEHDRHVMRQLMEQLRHEFDSKTWSAFEQFAIANRPAADVAEELGMTSNAVFIAKSRVLNRLRKESAGLLDD